MEPTKKELKEAQKKAEENRRQAENEWQKKTAVLDKFRTRIKEATKEAAQEGYMVELYVGCSGTPDAELGVRVRVRTFREIGMQQPET